MNTAEYVETLYKLIAKEKLGDAIADKLEIAELQRDFLIYAVTSAIAVLEATPAKTRDVIEELERVIIMLPYEVVQKVTEG